MNHDILYVDYLDIFKTWRPEHRLQDNLDVSELLRRIVIDNNLMIVIGKPNKKRFRMGRMKPLKFS